MSPGRLNAACSQLFSYSQQKEQQEVIHLNWQGTSVLWLIQCEKQTQLAFNCNFNGEQVTFAIAKLVQRSFHVHQC